MSAPTNVYDVTQPPDTQAANLLGLDLRNLALNVQQRMGLISGLAANIWNPGADAQPTNWTGLLYFATDTGHIFQWSGSAWVDVTTSFIAPPTSIQYKLEFISLAPVIVSNTGAQTPLMTFTLPANELGLNQFLHIKARGTFSNSTGTAQNTTLLLFLDGNTVLGAITSVNNGTWGWAFDADYILNMPGSLGNIECQANFNSAAPTGVILPSANTSFFSFNTTITHVISLAVVLGTVSPNFSATQRSMYVTRNG